MYWTIVRNTAEGTFTLTETADVGFNMTRTDTVDGVASQWWLQGTDHAVLASHGTYSGSGFAIAGLTLTEAGQESYQEFDAGMGRKVDSF